MSLLVHLAWALLAQAAPPPLSGVVVDQYGTPLAGAEVWLADPPTSDRPKSSGPARTDVEGRFTIAGPEAARGGGPFAPISLWAYAPGHRLGLRTFEGELPPPGEAIRIAVGPPARAIVRVEPPARGKVEVFAVHRRWAILPRPLIERLGVPIADDGIAALDGFAPEDLRGLDARTEAFGTQTRESYRPVPGDWTIRLRPIGHVAGKILADDPSKLKGWHVTAWTSPDDEPGDAGTVGNYWQDADDQGRFDFPTLASGDLTLMARPPAGAPYQVVQVVGKKVVAGTKLEVDIPTLRGVLVEGFVREAGTGAPMPGAWIGLFPKENFLGGQSEKTDERGHYAKVISPGPLTLHASGGPATHLMPPEISGRTFEVPAGVSRFELPTIEMTRGETIRGVVVDARGARVADAAVGISDPGSEEADFSPASTKARSDRSGAFEVQGLAPGSEVKLWAKRGGDATAGPISARAGAGAPVVLTFGPWEAVALRGRVLGPDGRPLAGALVQLRSKATGNGPPYWSETNVMLDGGDWLRTGPDGSFETPRELASRRMYRAEVVAQGMARAQTDWVGPPSNRFPDLTLRRVRTLRSVSGRVVDRAGGPVAGAVVLQSGDGPKPTRSASDADGRFRVDGVLDGRAFLFASAEGFRFQARPIGVGVADVEIVLTRDLERPAPPAPPDPR